MISAVTTPGYPTHTSSSCILFDWEYSTRFTSCMSSIPTWLAASSFTFRLRVADRVSAEAEAPDGGGGFGHSNRGSQW